MIAFRRLEGPTVESIRSFLRKYGVYVRELASRASQVVGAGITTEAVRPVALKYCVDQEYLEGLLVLGFIPTVSSYDELEDEELRQHLEKAVSTKYHITVDNLDRFVRKDLRLEMRENYAVSLLENLFIGYIALLRKHGVGWVIDDSPKNAVRHITSAVWKAALRTRLESDLAFGYTLLKNDFKAFMQHCLTLSEAFQIVDVGPSKNTETTDDVYSSVKPKVKSSGNVDGRERTRTAREPLVCLYEPHHVAGMRRLLKDCRECPENSKKTLLDKYHADWKAKGPTRNTRSQANRIVGRLERKHWHEKSMDLETSCLVRLADGCASLMASRRCDDRSDATIVSPKIAENSAIAGIGKICCIKPVKLQVALNDGEKAQEFKFALSWTCPRVILHLAAGQLVLFNVMFLVADGELSTGDLLIGLPVPRHLRADMSTLLERNRASLDGTDCAEVPGTTADCSSTQICRLPRTDVADPESNKCTEGNL